MPAQIGSRVCAIAASFILFAIAATPSPGDDAAVELRFDAPMTALISARYWDQTQEQWLSDADRERPLFFDAVHRFLLIRFPGCAASLHEQLAAGNEIVSAKLVMSWTGQEFLRVKDYSVRTWPIAEEDPPEWHARTWLLRQPWTDDPEIGPTWNAWLNGLGYWREGGAFDAGHDRFAEPLGDALVCERKPVGEVDVTATLMSGDFGADLPTRLKQLEDCGFLVAKAESFNPEFGGHAGGLGIARIWIEQPELIVTVRPKADQQIGALPAPADVGLLATRLRAEGPDGEPTTHVPEDLPALIAEYQSRHDDLPEWMQERVREVASIKTRWDEKGQPLYVRMMGAEAMDPEWYAAAVDGLLSVGPGYFMGHSHVDPIITLLDCGHMLPEAARYHLYMNTKCRWTRPFAEDEIRTRVGYHGSMATLNHQCQFRSEALLAGEMLDDRDLMTMAQRNLSLMNRQMMFLGGVIQERGDSFYQGISLSTLKTAATHSTDPLVRLKAELALEKMIWELNSTYHPGLRRHVSPVSRRYRIETLLLDQDIPRAVLHTLSREGAFIDMGRETVHDLRAFGFDSASPGRVAHLAPWGEEWEANAIDLKPLPFLSVGASYVRGLAPEPIHYTTYMGQHYALGSIQIDPGEEWPNQAVWNRSPETATTLDDLGVMFVWAYMNDAPVNPYEHEPKEKVKAAPLAAMLQHENKMIYVMRPPEPHMWGEFCADGIESLFSRVSVFAYGPEDQRRIFVNDTPVEGFPFSAKHLDRIALDEGATYVGLIPLPATDLGRESEVVISYEYPRLNLDSYVLKTDQALPADGAWSQLMNATAGWLVELADAEDYEDFADFRAHLQQMQVQADWRAEDRVLDVSWTTGDDLLEMGFDTSIERERYSRPWAPSRAVPYARVNGEWPWLPDDMLLDSPLGQLSRTGLAEKAGATLRTLPGQPAMLKVEPISGTWEAVNPFIDPVPLELTTPEGAIIRADGAFGCGRITVRPNENWVRVDYHLPPPGGDLGVEKLQEDAGMGLHAGPAEWESALGRFLRPNFDVREAREQSARSLLVTGMRTPLRFFLNGERVSVGTGTVREDGKTWTRLPIAPADE